MAELFAAQMYLIPLNAREIADGVPTKKKMERQIVNHHHRTQLQTYLNVV